MHSYTTIGIFLLLHFSDGSIYTKAYSNEVTKGTPNTNITYFI